MNFWEEITHFEPWEFESPDESNSGYKMQETTVRMLDEARQLCDFQFNISSGFRTKYHNKKVGGRRNSAHLKGYAADIKCLTSQKRFKMIKALMAVGFNRIGISERFIHVDNDPNLVKDVIWTY